ncbi:MAG: DNA internalization-related competence protein ComEC/Rec2 [Halieaceae bacterium]|nr:DNA internalization-related competence protein ComEC/Rec2 [Halieaceae bacterium]
MRRYLLGLFLGTMLTTCLAALPLGSAGGAAVVTGAWIGWRMPMLRMAGGALSGLGWGTIYATQRLKRTLPKDCLRERLEIAGTVSGLPQRWVTVGRPPVHSFDFEVARLEPERCQGPVKLRLNYYGERTIKAGESLQLNVRLRRPRGLANPGVVPREAWYHLNGIDALGSVSGQPLDLAHSTASAGSIHSIGAGVARLRATISEAIDQTSIHEGSAAILKALAVADRSGISPELWRLFQQLGVVHVLVVSGLHIGLVALMGLGLGAGLNRVLGLLGLAPRWLLGPALGAMSAGAYAALAGFSLPTVRALVMVWVMLAALASARMASSARALVLAVTLIVLWQPLSPISPGFWLSAGAVALLLWWSLWQPSRQKWSTVWRTHLYMCLVMMPLTAVWFSGVSTVAALANMITVPLISIWVVPLTLIGIPLSIISQPMADLAWRLASWPLNTWLQLAQGFHWVLGQSVYINTGMGISSAMLALIVMLALLLPVGVRARALLASALVAVLASPNPAPSWASRLVVLDVGQGTAVVFQEGKRAALIDTGGGDPAAITRLDAVVLPWLQREGIRELDTLVVSHADLDHSAGASALLRRLPVSRVRLGEALGAHGPLVLASGADVSRCRLGESWRWSDDTHFTVMSGVDRRLSGNDASCVIAINSHGVRFLLPGDITAGLEKSLVRYWQEDLKSEVLLASHHGSLSSSSSAWLRRVDATSVVYSAGYANAFGHPHWRVEKRVDLTGAHSVVTGEHGALEYRVGADGSLTLTRHSFSPRYWWM